MINNKSSFRSVLPLQTHIDFIGKRLTWISVSLVFMVLSMLLLILRGIPIGIDFSGGTMAEIRFPKENIAPKEVKNAISELVKDNVIIQPVDINSGSAFLVRFPVIDDLNTFSNELFRKLKNAFGKSAKLVRAEMVGPKMGKELRTKSYIAVGFTCIAMLTYIAFRFEFAYGIGTIAGIIHDILIALGTMSLFEKQFSLVTMAALLTIMGYSVNDTIVVCDRIRENLKKKGLKGNLAHVINISINQTLSRTIITSFTVLLVLISLLFLGTTILKDFSFVMIVGVIVGTYSSIYIVAPIVLFWKSFAKT